MRNFAYIELHVVATIPYAGQRVGRESLTACIALEERQAVAVLLGHVDGTATLIRWRGSGEG
jgi:hypothetical protein